MLAVLAVGFAWLFVRPDLSLATDVHDADGALEMDALQVDREAPRQVDRHRARRRSSTQRAAAWCGGGPASEAAASEALARKAIAVLSELGLPGDAEELRALGKESAAHLAEWWSLDASVRAAVSANATPAATPNASVELDKIANFEPRYFALRTEPLRHLVRDVEVHAA